MLALVYWIDFVMDISLCFQPEEESETSNILEYGCLKFYTSLLMCVVAAFRVSFASLVQYTKIGYLIYKRHQEQVSWLQLGQNLTCINQSEKLPTKQHPHILKLA